MSATHDLQTEDIMWAVMDTLESYLPAYLLVVQGLRTREPLILPTPARYVIGFDDAQDVDKDDYPVVAWIGSGVTSADELRRSERIQAGLHRVLLEWNILVPWRKDALLTAQQQNDRLRLEATLMAYRYGEAIFGVMRRHMPYAGWSMINTVPSYEEALAAAVRLNGNSTRADGMLGGGRLDIAMSGRYMR